MSAGETTPLTVYLPFNRDCLRGTFVPAKDADRLPEPAGEWLIVQDQSLLVVPEGGDLRLPCGPLPAGLEPVLERPIWLGTHDGVPCWVTALAPEAPVPPGLHRETLIPMKAPRISDELLSLGGMALQAVHWETTSRHCPRCGEGTERIEGEFGKRCRRCRYEHYPHLHPAVIILVRDGGRCLLTRKAGWAPGRYALVAGFVDNGESLEGAVRREVREEVGVEVRDIQYVGSQNWPFPSQLMIGFVAAYAGGEVTIDHTELEDARWFSCERLPEGPSRHSIARFIIDHYARAQGEAVEAAP
jgi:NAD+ diphosphatase